MCLKFSIKIIKNAKSHKVTGKITLYVSNFQLRLSKMTKVTKSQEKEHILNSNNENNRSKVTKSQEKDHTLYSKTENN